jgi:pimeloyl-ACP methyl ester carboxylesterase
VTDVVNQILYEDLRDFVLVGFSYGGFVVTGALEHIADRVQHLVYLDAFVPKNGDTVWGQVRGAGRARIEIGQGWLMDGPVREFDDPDEASWMRARRTPHPIGCFNEAVYLSKPLEDYAFTRTYVKASASAKGDPGNEAFLKAATHAAASSSWQYFEVATNHMLASNKPAETAAILHHLTDAA